MRFRLNSKGFSMIELAIVVAIVGALVTMAVPSYQGFVARAKQSEAKTSLARIYTSELSFLSEWGWYTICLKQAGYTPPEGPTYYLTGFLNAAGAYPISAHYTTDMTVAACNTGPDPDTHEQPQHNDATWLPTTSAVPGAGLVCPSAAYETTQTTFNALACGMISNTTNADVWTINEKRVLVNLQQGF